MRGYMRQRGLSWDLRVFVGNDAITGKKRYATKTVRGGKREAQRMLASMVVEAERGATARTELTVGEVLELWFEAARLDFSPKTVKEVRGYLDRHLVADLGAIRLDRLKPHDLDVYYARLRAGGGRSGHPLAPATVKRVHGILHRALQQAKKWGWIGVNPAAAATPPRVVQAEIRPPSPGDVAALFTLAGQDAPMFAVFVVVAAATGARRSEVVALRWRDIDFEQRCVTFSRGIVFGIDGMVEKDTKTHQARRVSLDTTTVELLGVHRQQMGDRAVACSAELGDDGYVFSDHPTGAVPWRPDSVSRSFRRLSDRAGLPGVRLHDLRHYVATRLLASGVDVRTVAGRLGHRNTSTTLNVYSHFLAETDRCAADILGQLFNDAVDGANKIGQSR